MASSRSSLAPLAKKETALLALNACCSCSSEAEELGIQFDHVVLQHQGDSQTLISVAQIIATYPAELALIPLKRLSAEVSSSSWVWLRLLKALVQNKDFQPTSMWFDTSIAILQACIQRFNEEDFARTVEVVCLIVRCSTGRETSVVQFLRDDIWQVLQRRILSGEALTANSYKAWIKWLQSPGDLQPTVAQTSSAQYTACIKAGLSSGSQEIQKLSLFVFRQSHVIVETSSRSSSQDLNHYCRAFETIYMGGYPVQALECLMTLNPELLLIDPEANELAVDGSWWALLASATLAWSRSDNTKKDVGYWILRHEYQDLREHESFINFLCTSLLPWANQGGLFQYSVKRNGSSVICRHGNELAFFVTRILGCSSSLDVQQVYLCLTLESLLEERTSAYAWAYILRGVINHFNEENKMAHSSDLLKTMDDLLSCFSTLQLTKRQRFVVGRQLNTLSRILKHPESSPQPNDPINLAPIDTDWFATDHSNSLQHILRLSIGQVGLAETCKRVVFLLRHDSLPLKTKVTEDAGTAFTYLWSECRRLRHPREVVSVLPMILLSDVVMLECSKSTSLQNVVFKVIREIFDLAQTRIYVWTPLTRELYHAYSMHNSSSELKIMLGELIVQFVRKPPTPSLEYLLECAILDLLEDGSQQSSEAHGSQLDEGLGHAHLFEVLNRLKRSDLDLGMDLIAQFLLPWSTPPAKQTDKLKTEYALQGVVVLVKRCVHADENAPQVLALLQTALKWEKSPRYRYLLEFAIVSCYWTYDEEIEQKSLDSVIGNLSAASDDDVSPRDIVTRLKISVSIARHPHITTLFIESLVSWLPALCASSRVAIRFEALYTILSIMEIATAKGLDTITTNIAYERLYQHALALLKAKGTSTSRQMESFDSTKDQCLAALFEGAYLRLENHSTSPIKADYFRLIQSESDQEKTSPAMPIGTHEPDIHVAETLRPGNAVATFDVNYQSKSFAIPEKDLEIISVPIPRPKEVILVASLIDAPINVGGLCRAAEIYGCSELHVPSLSMMGDRGFTSTSVSSESHITIIQTRQSDLRDYLTTKRQEGFTILGVEQTESSIELGAATSKLPKKVVVVMGAERTGIAADILVECDVCVEIKQWGVTRSLNVQTAAATLLYEWRRQHG